MQEPLATSSAFANIPPEWLYAAGGFALGALVAAFIFQRTRARLLIEHEKLKAHLQAGIDARAAMEDHFKVSAQEALKSAQQSFLDLAQEKLGAANKDSAHELEKRHKAIETLIAPVQEHLKTLGAAVEQAKGTDQALREDLKNLSLETAKLVGALRDPSAQGLWGEFILEGVLEKSGLLKGVHYDTQVSMATADGRQRPDALINMQDGFKIAIDAKAPLNEFVQRLSDQLTEAEHTQLMHNLARQVREHVKALAKRGYWENIDSPDFTVMFLPSEHVYSIALRADPSLVDFAAKNNVIIASPTLLMSLVRVVGLSWRQAELAKNAAEISERGADLYKRLLKFTDHIGKIGGHLQSAMKGYNEAVGSLERTVLPAARKFRDLQALSGEKDMPALEIPEESPRLIALAAEDETMKKRA
jgi:DNA recombination protein RmuC